MSTLQRLTDRGLVKPPRWLPGNVQYSRGLALWKSRWVPREVRTPNPRRD